MAKQKLRITGKTEDGKTLVHGGDVFRFQDTDGIPLEMSLDHLTTHQCVVSWLDWWDEAMGQGWTPTRALQTLSAAWGDVFGPNVRVKLEARLQEAITVREAYSRAG